MGLQVQFSHASSTDHHSLFRSSLLFTRGVKVSPGVSVFGRFLCLRSFVVCDTSGVDPENETVRDRTTGTSSVKDSACVVSGTSLDLLCYS